jgi:hypothetical protein
MASLIKLRRDTSIAWTQVNPTLAAGEPGLETDTLKIKYGDGSTAWNNLGYGSSSGSASLPTASTTVLGGVKVDGSTITINNGVISATAGGGSGSGTVLAGTGSSLAFYPGDGTAVDNAVGLTWDNANNIFKVAGLTELQQTTEVLATKTSAAGIVTHDFNTSAIWYHSAVTSGFIANITNIPTTSNRATVITIMIAQGSTPYVPTGIQINGVAQPVLWQGGVAPTGNANKLDLLSYSILRIGSSWVATGSLSTYG